MSILLALALHVYAVRHTLTINVESIISTNCPGNPGIFLDFFYLFMESIDHFTCSLLQNNKIQQSKYILILPLTESLYKFILI